MTRQTILVTGASSGLGKGMALEFAKMGRDLALCARRMDNLEELKAEISAVNPKVRVSIRELDVNDHEQVFAVFNAFRDEFGTLDRIIVNAGIGKGASVGTGYWKANVQTATTNFVAAVVQCEAAMAIFREQNAGHLVTISSISAVSPYRRAMTVYAATKAGLTSMTNGIRVDCLGTPIAVSCVHPGFIETAINEKVKVKPFSVPLAVGSPLLVKAIESEKANTYVPRWPWALFQVWLRIAPAGYLRKLS